MYDQAIELNPNNPSYYNNKGKKYFKKLGLSLHNLKRYEETI